MVFFWGCFNSAFGSLDGPCVDSELSAQSWVISRRACVVSIGSSCFGFLCYRPDSSKGVNSVQYSNPQRCCIPWPSETSDCNLGLLSCSGERHLNTSVGCCSSVGGGTESEHTFRQIGFRTPLRASLGEMDDSSAHELPIPVTSSESQDPAGQSGPSGAAHVESSNSVHPPEEKRSRIEEPSSSQQVATGAIYVRDDGEFEEVESSSETSSVRSRSVLRQVIPRPLNRLSLIHI